MKKLLALFILLSCLAVYGQDPVIKSLQAYSGSDQLSIPLVMQSKESKKNLTIEFDVASNFEPNLVIEFRFCDFNWTPYENLFLINQGRNTTRLLWFETIRTPNAGANYHFKDSYPNFDVNFPFPGKWIYIIRDSMNKNRIYAQGGFFVVNESLPIKTAVKREVLDGPLSGLVELNRAFSLDMSFVLPDSLFPSNVTGVEVIENRKFLSPYSVGRMNTGLRNFYYDGGRNFLFNIRDLRPGNGYRSLDLRDKGKYNYPETNARFDGIENDEFYKMRKHDLVGGSLIMNYRNENAQYIKVKFRLRPSESINKKVFVAGSFTNWLVLPQYEMKLENGFYSLDVELKRGEYDYQYVLADIDGNGNVSNIDFYTLNGNFWETDNDYHIFVFYFTPDKGGYNKIIGYKKMRSGGL